MPWHLDGRIFCGVCGSGSGSVTTSSVLLMLFTATFLFYAVTGYKFRPMSANPCVYIVQARALLLLVICTASDYLAESYDAWKIGFVLTWYTRRRRAGLTGTLGYPRKTRRNCGSSKWSRLLWRTAQTCSTGLYGFGVLQTASGVFRCKGA